MKAEEKKFSRGFAHTRGRFSDETYVATLLIQTSDSRRHALRSLEKMPPFSPVLQRLLASLLNPDISIIELSNLIEKDAVLTSYVLRMVNSAAFGRRGTVTAVSHAIALLGLIKLRNALISFSVCQLWSKLSTPVSWSSMRFNLHSVATAVMADMIVQKIPTRYGEGAFVSGMLHDLGKLLIAVSYPAQFEEVRLLHLSTGRPWHECELEILQVDHADLSAAALSRWNLPDAVRMAVAQHHEVYAKVQAGKREPLALGQVLQAADQFANATGFGLLVRPDGEGKSIEEEKISSDLSLDPDLEHGIRISFAREMDQIGSFFKP